MPIYEFNCKKCEHEWDDIRKMGDQVPGPCPECGSEKTAKGLSKGSFILKGTGWAKDGYFSGKK